MIPIDAPATIPITSPSVVLLGEIFGNGLCFPNFLPPKYPKMSAVAATTTGHRIMFQYIVLDATTITPKNSITSIEIIPTAAASLNETPLTEVVTIKIMNVKNSIKNVIPIVGGPLITPVSAKYPKIPANANPNNAIAIKISLKVAILNFFSKLSLRD